jgi:glycine/D-amino acid oxidase-like deaminating enzyme
MSPPVDRIASDERLPEAADVVVIGGGIIGASAAWHLAKEGHSVALVEKGHVAGEQSSRNWGWCRQQGRDPVEIPLARASLEIWGGMAEAIGADPGFRRTGIIRATKDPEEMARWEAWATLAREMQVHTRVLGATELSGMLPGNVERYVGGLYTPSDGRAEPATAAPALAAAARRLGVSIHQGCAARGIETRGGAVDAVVTEKGRIRTGAVILAGGAWSALFLRRHGIRLPAAVVNATAFRTGPGIDITEGGLSTAAFCTRRRLDGGYTVALAGRGTLELTPDNLRHLRAFWPMFLKRRKNLRIRVGQRFVDGLRQRADWSFDAPSPFEAERVRDPAPNPELAERALASLRAAYPTLRRIEIAEVWGGAIDTTPDAIPVISPAEGMPGLVLATGFSGHGFGIGPAAGRLAANLAVGDPPLVDPHPFRHGRFLRGEPIRPSRSL